MDLKDIVSSMTQEMRDNLAYAVEIGKWQDGTPLTEQQKSSSLQALIAWDSYHGEVTDEPFKVQKGGKLNRNAKKASSTTNNKANQTIIKTTNIDN